ncbi:MAG: dienelactone hydrolase family protein [Sphingomonas bacterium]|nr:dienelactone hydrolase family protein [Sphingomonas bacterium]
MDAFINRKLDQYGLTESDLTLVSFSQGKMMALHIGLRRERQLAAIVGYSGMLTGAARLSRESKTTPPVLLVHGSADPVVPVTALHDTKSGLERLGISVTTHVFNGLGHSVDPVGLKLGGEFVVTAFSEGANVPAAERN